MKPKVIIASLANRVLAGEIAWCNRNEKRDKLVSKEWKGGFKAGLQHAKDLMRKIKD